MKKIILIILSALLYLAPIVSSSANIVEPKTCMFTITSAEGHHSSFECQKTLERHIKHPRLGDLTFISTITRHANTLYCEVSIIDDGLLDRSVAKQRKVIENGSCNAYLTFEAWVLDASVFSIDQQM